MWVEDDGCGMEEEALSRAAPRARKMPRRLKNTPPVTPSDSPLLLFGISLLLISLSLQGKEDLFHSYWTVSFQSREMTAELILNGVSGQVLDASINCYVPLEYQDGGGLSAQIKMKLKHFHTLDHLALRVVRPAQK